MSTEVTTPPASGATLRGDRGWTLLRQGLLVLALVLVVVTVALGHRVSHLSDLEDDLRAGRVDTVHVAGGLGEGGMGYAQQLVTWRSGPFRHVAEVTQASSRDDAADARNDGDESRTVVRQDVGARLLAERPGLEVVRDRTQDTYVDSELWGWEPPVPLFLPLLGLFLLVFVLLVSGPEPWRATRWAWFWLLGVPGGVVLFLLLSGTGPVPPPRRPERRLRGGWAFLILLLLG